MPAGRKKVIFGAYIAALLAGYFSPIMIYIPDPLDKYCHFLGFGTIGLLASYCSENRTQWVVYGALGLMLAIVGEFVQIAIPNRDFELPDMLANALGLALGLTAYSGARWAARSARIVFNHVRLLRQIQRELEAGSDLASACQKVGISDSMYYLWRKRYRYSPI